MQLHYLKRGICLLLAMVMVFSAMPMQALAAGTEHHDHLAEPGITAPDPQLRAQTDALLLNYLGTTSLTERQILATVEAMDADTIRQAVVEIEDMLDPLRSMRDEELRAFADANPAFAEFAEAVMSAESGIGDCGIMPMASSGTILDGQITVTDTASNVSVSGNNVTVTISVRGGLLENKTASNTVTITNTSGATAVSVPKCKITSKVT